MKICVVLCTRAHLPVRPAGSSCPRALAGAAGAPIQRERAGRAAESEQTVLSWLQHCLVSWMSWQCGHRHRYRSRRLSDGQGRQAAGSVILTLSVVGSHPRRNGASFTQRRLDVFRYIPCHCNTSMQQFREHHDPAMYVMNLLSHTGCISSVSPLSAAGSMVNIFSSAFTMCLKSFPERSATVKPINFIRFRSAFCIAWINKPIHSPSLALFLLSRHIMAISARRRHL